MHPYIEQLRNQLPRSFETSVESDVQTAAEILYAYYREHHPADPVEIKGNFAGLDDALRKLTLRECDRVWDLCCDLCIAHEKEGFLSGLRIGAALAAELIEG